MEYYRITNIKSKDPDTYNIYHDFMRGNQCEKPDITLGERAFIRYNEKGIWHCLLTSVVVSVKTYMGGDVIEMETHNTFYRFEREYIE